jgi:aminoglycoside phosphotransferase (APT) family kinase protein
VYKPCSSASRSTPSSISPNNTSFNLALNEVLWHNAARPHCNLDYTRRVLAHFSYFAFASEKTDLEKRNGMRAGDRLQLDSLLEMAGFVAVQAAQQISGRGFENRIYKITLIDGQELILRCYPQERPLETARAKFLEQYDLPAPKLYACNEQAALFSYISGTLLGDLIESGLADDRVWQELGRTFSQVHAIQFPQGVVGTISAEGLNLSFRDPVEQLHSWIDQASVGLERRLPEIVELLPELHRYVDLAAQLLRQDRVSLGHGDINMWNTIINRDGAYLIDWDFPVVTWPTSEIALLDKHAALFNGIGLPEAFFQAYQPQLNRDLLLLYRVVHSLTWFASDDWDEFAQSELPSEQIQRTRNWYEYLREYTKRLEDHLQILSKASFECKPG